MRFYHLILFTAILSCGLSNLQAQNKEVYIMVQEAEYLDKEANNIQLSSMIGFGTDSSGEENITNVNITLERGQESWNMFHNNSKPGTYYLEDSPFLLPGKTLHLKVELDDEVLTATTVIPGDPPAVSMSSFSLLFLGSKA